jgi:hypothetical protein
MSRELAMGLMARFFGSVICGIFLSMGFLGAATIWRPYDPLDTWADVRHDVLAISIVGAIAGAIVGLLWSIWAVELRLDRPTSQPRA